jgi:hypothetical protein
MFVFPEVDVVVGAGVAAVVAGQLVFNNGRRLHSSGWFWG